MWFTIDKLDGLTHFFSQSQDVAVPYRGLAPQKVLRQDEISHDITCNNQIFLT